MQFPNINKLSQGDVFFDLPFGGLAGKSDPSTSLQWKTPPTKGVPSGWVGYLKLWGWRVEIILALFKTRREKKKGFLFLPGPSISACISVRISSSEGTTRIPLGGEAKSVRSSRMSLAATCGERFSWDYMHLLN